MISKIPCSSIIFDCDGVIFDSNKLKADAFRSALIGYPTTIIEEFVSYHIENAGISRYVKFRLFIEKILKKKFDEEEYNRLLKLYGDSCVELYKKVDMTPSSKKVITELSKYIPLYVASGSDEAELRNVFYARGLKNNFRKILGSPKTKRECVRGALFDLGFSKNVIMVGDAESDYLAATQEGLHFIYMSQFSESQAKMDKIAKNNLFPEIKNLELLMEYITVDNLS